MRLGLSALLRTSPGTSFFYFLSELLLSSHSHHFNKRGIREVRLARFGDAYGILSSMARARGVRLRAAPVHYDRFSRSDTSVVT